MRRVMASAALVVLGAACSVNADERAGENRVTFDELTEAMLDPDAELDFGEVDGIDLEQYGPVSESFCEAFAAVPVTWVDDAVVPVQMFVDAWEPVTDAPDAVAEDVAEVRAFGSRKLDWNFGRIDREDRPIADATLMDRLERIADTAVDRCDELPLRIGYPENWAALQRWEPDEIERRCGESLETAERGLPLYRQLRGREPGHFIQIELAALADWHRSFASDEDGPPLWFVPELHGIDASSGTAEIVAMAPCNET